MMYKDAIGLLKKAAGPLPGMEEAGRQPAVETPTLLGKAYMDQRHAEALKRHPAQSRQMAQTQAQGQLDAVKGGFKSFLDHFKSPQTYVDWANDIGTWTNNALAKIPGGGLRLMGRAADLGRGVANVAYNAPRYAASLRTGKPFEWYDAMNTAQPNYLSQAASYIDNKVGTPIARIANYINPFKAAAKVGNGILNGGSYQAPSGPQNYSQWLASAPGSGTVMGATEDAVGEAIWPWATTKAVKAIKSKPVKVQEGMPEMRPQGVMQDSGAGNRSNYMTNGDLYEHYTTEAPGTVDYGKPGDHMWASPTKGMPIEVRASNFAEKRPYREFFDDTAMQRWGGRKRGPVLLNYDEPIGNANWSHYRDGYKVTEPTLFDQFTKEHTYDWLGDPKTIDHSKALWEGASNGSTTGGWLYHNGSRPAREIIARAQELDPKRMANTLRINTGRAGNQLYPPGLVESVADTGPELARSMKGFQNTGNGYLYAPHGATLTDMLPAPGQGVTFTPWNQYWNNIGNQAAVAGATSGKGK